MASRRDIRQLAMQVLYQIDVRGTEDLDSIRESVRDADDLDMDGLSREEGIALAEAAWQGRDDGDDLLAELAPQWPTYRQPPLDRAILRLAYHELVTGRAPRKVVINEAVELAKHFCGEQSPAFINGVLDKIARRLEPPV